MNQRLSFQLLVSKLYRAMIEIGRFAITANYIYDDQATELARKEAIEAVEPVMIRESTYYRRRRSYYFDGL
ncbi:hypothetical protein KHA80_03645 [Anaerobacillus sp. HL2]|nr:hypothetical protein KHA80_03645 [Anaerobacillus sp. HL2]